MLEIVQAPDRTMTAPLRALTAGTGVDVTVVVGKVRAARGAGWLHNRRGGPLAHTIAREGLAAVVMIEYRLA
jgi:hypothetical protein